MIVNDPVTSQHAFSNLAGNSLSANAANRNRRWFRRPSRVIPVALLTVALVVAAIVGYRTMAAFDTVQSLSTPPPEVSGAALGGESDIAIDTGPAREAVRQRQEADRARQQLPTDTATGPSGGSDGLAVVGAAIQPEPTEQSAAQGPTEQSAALEPSRQTPIAGDTALTLPAPTADVATVAATEQSSPGEEPAGAAYVVAGTTFLLMGVDARSGESIDIGVRPDALAVLHLDDDGSCRMLAIPRDSRATLPGYGMSKINHALAIGGIPYEIQVVEEYLGIEIDHYGLVDFAGITRIVDSVGGIDVDNPAAFIVGDDDFAAGPISLDGDRALMYARYRGGADGDFGRIAKQQQVMRAVLDRGTDVNLVSFVPGSFSLLSDHIRTDLGPATIVDLGAEHLDSCTAESLETRTIPGDVTMLYDELLQMQLSFVVSDGNDVRETVDWLLSEQ